MIWALLILLTVAADQISKLIVLDKMTLGQSITIIDKFFYFTYWENKGAAWGIFQNGRYFFIIFTAIISLFMCYLLFKAKNRLYRLSLSLILGGAIGNLIDRVYKGSVTDFLDFYIFSYDFPIFNLADTFVVVGTMLLAYYIFFIYEEKGKEKVDDV